MWKMQLYCPRINVKTLINLQSQHFSGQADEAREENLAEKINKKKKQDLSQGQDSSPDSALPIT